MTVTIAVVEFISESVTVTVSVTLGVSPAVNRPFASIEPPELFCESEALGGEMEISGPTATVAVAGSPSESVHVTVSMTLPVAPAVYAPLAATIIAPEGLVVTA
ncbi:MAG: hypothetical protein IPJ65_14030 [Archangiaceae bacterium]|nr:hypothetical protein [Archangiaceae bacterium]